jgi:hypothetical protein
VFCFIALVYFLLSFYYFFYCSEGGGGDESLFINDLLFIQTKGWFLALEKSISIPYLILGYPLSFFLKGYIALRVATVLVMLLLFFYFFKIVKIKATYFYGYLFFYMGTVPYFFVGTNDALFFTGLIVFMTEVFFFLENKKMNNQALAFSGLVISFFTRELILVYFPVVLLSFYFLYKAKFSFWSKKMVVPAVLFFFFLVLNIPCLLSKGKLSYDDKTPPITVKSSWSQRQYLAQLLVNKGELQNFSHPSWEQTDLYLKENGSDSLPNGILNGLTFDYRLTIKEFFKDFYYSLFFGFRQLGLLLLFPFYFIIKSIRKKTFWDLSLYIPYSLLLLLTIFSLIIISYIEARWHIAVFVLSIIFYTYYQLNNSINKGIVVANYTVLLSFSVWGIYGILHKFMGVI